MPGPPVPPPTAPSMTPSCPNAAIARARIFLGTMSATSAVHAGIAMVEATATAARISSTLVKLLAKTNSGIETSASSSAESSDTVSSPTAHQKPTWNEHGKPQCSFYQQDEAPL